MKEQNNNFKKHSLDLESNYSNKKQKTDKILYNLIDYFIASKLEEVEKDVSSMDHDFYNDLVYIVVRIQEDSADAFVSIEAFQNAVMIALHGNYEIESDTFFTELSEFLSNQYSQNDVPEKNEQTIYFSFRLHLADLANNQEYNNDEDLVIYKLFEIITNIYNQNSNNFTGPFRLRDSVIRNKEIILSEQEINLISSIILNFYKNFINNFHDNNINHNQETSFKPEIKQSVKTINNLSNRKKVDDLYNSLLNFITHRHEKLNEELVQTPLLEKDIRFEKTTLNFLKYFIKEKYKDSMHLFLDIDTLLNILKDAFMRRYNNSELFNNFWSEFITISLKNKKDFCNEIKKPSSSLNEDDQYEVDDLYYTFLDFFENKIGKLIEISVKNPLLAREMRDEIAKLEFIQDLVKEKYIDSTQSFLQINFLRTILFDAFQEKFNNEAVFNEFWNKFLHYDLNGEDNSYPNEEEIIQSFQFNFQNSSNVNSSEIRSTTTNSEIDLLHGLPSFGTEIIEGCDWNL
jgi:hypothetical protein